MDLVILLVSQAQSHLTSILLTCRHRFLLCPTTYLGGKVNRAHATGNPDSPDRTAGAKTFQASTSRAPIQFSLILQVTFISTISVQTTTEIIFLLHGEKLVLQRQELPDLVYMTNLRSNKLYAGSMLSCKFDLEGKPWKSSQLWCYHLHCICSNESMQGICLNPKHSLTSELV